MNNKRHFYQEISRVLALCQEWEQRPKVFLLYHTVILLKALTKAKLPFRSVSTRL